MKSILSFSPIYIHVIWGGDRIARFKGVASQGDDVGESWELSPMPGRVSVVDNGLFSGRTLNSLVSEYGIDIMGKRLHEKHNGNFPLLIKFIDSKRDLSIQVHPDNEMAEKEEGKLGKSEMWYCIDPQPEAYLYAGFNMPLTPESFKDLVEESKIVDALCRYQTHPGDAFYISSGTVHSLGNGNLVVEIQDASDVTYRIFDYNRLGTDGKPRELHVEKATRALNFEDSRHPSPINVVPDKNSCTPLIHCECFNSDILEVDGSMALDLRERDSFTILISLSGNMTLKGADGDCITIGAGRTLLLPNALENAEISGKGRLISVYIP